MSTIKETLINNDTFRFIGLGGSNEVGRSCHIIEFKGKIIMLDAGIHPAYRGMLSLPYFDLYDLSKVDVLLISHFHLDHVASLPYVLQKTNFKGRVLMTHPTKAIYRWLMKDFVKVTTIADEFLVSDDSSNLYSDEDLINSFDRIETIDFHSTIDINGIKVTAYHAGHVLGAAMFQIDIGGIKVLFTGDYSREVDRHLNSAELPVESTDVLIVESTFGTATHQPRKQREKKFTQMIHETVKKGGRVLLPVFALGRAQELMLILDEYWSQNDNELGHGRVPIYYASDLAKKCLNVFQTYINMMNDDIRTKFRDSKSNPFNFKNIAYLKSLDNFRDLGPSVMLASPGMLQSGVSREILEKWCPDGKNLVLVTGYSVEGTMAKFLMMQPDTIPSYENPDVNITRKCKVEEITFAAHVDFIENIDFIEKIGAQNIILVHGESSPMGRLKSALLSKFKHLKKTDKEVKVYTPYNGVNVDVKFNRDKVATLVGTIFEEVSSKLKNNNKQAAAKIEELDGVKNEDISLEKVAKENVDVEEVDTGIKVSGLLVNNTENFKLDFVSVENIREFHTDLKTTIIKERQCLKINCRKELIFWHVSQMYEDVKVLVDDENVSNTEINNEKANIKNSKLVLNIMGIVILNIEGDFVTVEWAQSVLNDIIADSLMTILLSLESLPVSVKMSTKAHDHHIHSEFDSDNKQEIKILQKCESLHKLISSEISKEEDIFLEKLTTVVDLFREQFGDSFELSIPTDSFKLGSSEVKGTLNLGSQKAVVDFKTFSVIECSSNPLRGRIDAILNISEDLLSPLL
ncbi:hypothetical protein QEN19_000424 [Hanseniaspora menglaensis]